METLSTAMTRSGSTGTGSMKPRRKGPAPAIGEYNVWWPAVTTVLEIQGLRKTYRRRWRSPRRALDGFDMVVEAGQVHGFLGPNGSGKTTTLRTLLGLVRPNGGTMRILGHELPSDLPVVAGRVGAIVESPQFFGNFSGRRTLKLLA